MPNLTGQYLSWQHPYGGEVQQIPIVSDAHHNGHVSYVKYNSHGLGLGIHIVPYPDSHYGMTYIGPNPEQVYPMMTGFNAPQPNIAVAVAAVPNWYASTDPSTQEYTEIYGGAEEASSDFGAPPTKKDMNASIDKPFCIILNPKASALRRYGTEEAARLDAEKSVKSKPGMELVVMKAIGKVSTNKPEVKHVDWEENAS